ncbi:hypothetical protein ACFYPC_10755 [Streptomyces sp. NPDC005808]|uniref:hypothetical protein n=1 Tax=Streptomyces sp. NPDC005808 TaxID=3364734 RepID=UPI00367429E1
MDTTAVRIRSPRRDCVAVSALGVLALLRALVERQGRTTATVTHDPMGAKC